MSKGQVFLDKLLQLYQSDFNIERSFSVNGDQYDAHAFFSVTSAKYVLVKSAELWRANCFEHAFFRVTGLLEPEEIERFRSQIDSYIEPELVRKGEKWPEKDHMYTYITAVYICEDGISPEAEKALRKFRKEKNYLLTIRGYCQARILVFDLKRGKILGNPAAKVLVKGYKKSGILQRNTGTLF